MLAGRLPTPPLQDFLDFLGLLMGSASSLSGVASSLGASCFYFTRSDLTGSLHRKPALARAELQPPWEPPNL